MLKQWQKHIVRENRIYIIPSARGFLFFSVIIIMILAGATYNNNLIFLLSFFLFSAFVTSMVQTHYILKGVQIEFVGSEDGFEGDRVALHFQIRQSHLRHRRGLLIRSLSRRFSTKSNAIENLTPMEQSRPARIEVAAWKRGVHAVPEMVLETYFPMGLFRAWKVFRPAGEMYVYPRAFGRLKLPNASYDFGQQDFGLRSSPEGDFGELKNYQEGESYRQIAWKHYARTRKLFTKVHWGQENKHYQIPWSPNSKDLEAYLMQMSQWVVTALEEEASFELETPDLKVESGRGLEHSKMCLRALAAVKGAA